MPASSTLEEKMLQQGYITPQRAAELGGLASGSFSRLANLQTIKSQRVGRAIYLEIAGCAAYLGPMGPTLLADVMQYVPAEGSAPAPAAAPAKKVTAKPPRVRKKKGAKAPAAPPLDPDDVPLEHP